MDDDSNLERDRFSDHLGVNRMGRGIRKSPLHQPTFSSSAARPQQPPPRVYNISKNDFRSVVQQLTGSPSRDPYPPPPPAQLAGSRLQRIRPPSLSPAVLPPPERPTLSPHLHSFWTNTSESPVSAYMGSLQNLIMDPGLGPAQPTPRRNPPLPSPTWSFLELLSPPPRSPYRPGYQYQPPLTPSFFFSPTTTAPPFGAGPRPPPSPGGFPPPSPGFFPILSPRWRN